MKFYMPVKVYDEPDCVENHKNELSAFGKKALIVTGKYSAFSNGSFDDAAKALKHNNIEFEIFSDVEENPSVETVFAAKETFSSENIDFVIGIGGGSAMDASKAIALTLAHPDYTPADLYDTSKNSSALPVICIPTTCGTGSEVTGVSVLTRHDKKTKISMVHKVFPSYAMVDGKYLKSAPLSLICNSAIDSLSHMYESLLNTKTDDYVRMTATAGLKMWSEIKDCLTGNRDIQDNDRTYLMRSSTLAGMSIAQSGTTLPHALSYALTYDLGIAHGPAVGYFLPGFLSAAPEKDRDEILHLSGFSDIYDFCGYIKKVLGNTDVPENELKRAYETVKNNPSKMHSASFDVDDSLLHSIVFFS